MSSIIRINIGPCLLRKRGLSDGYDEHQKMTTGIFQVTLNRVCKQTRACLIQTYPLLLRQLLKDFLADVEIGVDFLHVVMIVQLFHHLD